jgi:hypothetical protein
VLVAVHGERHDAGVGAGLADPPGGGDAAHPGHGHVEHRQVRLKLACETHCFVALGGLGDDLPIRLPREQRGQAFAK